MRFLFKALLAATALIPVATAASAQDAPQRERGERGERGDRGGWRGDRGEARDQRQAPDRGQQQPPAQRVGIDRDMARGGEGYVGRQQQRGDPDRQPRPGVGLGGNVQTDGNVGRDGVRGRGDLRVRAGADWQRDRPRQDVSRRDGWPSSAFPGAPGQRQGYRADRRPGDGAFGQRDRDVNRGAGYGQRDWNRGGNDGWRGDDGRRGTNGFGDRFDDRRSNRNWTNTWRNDRRYDWGGYRNTNRNAYRLPRYYAPYGWSQGYRRFSAGITLNAILFGEDYWIDDPYAYRLPDAYGPYRWVRYYNDALLVDVRYGRVVDVVHDIFW